MAVQYRIRTPFRVAAAIAAVVLSSVGAAFVGVGLKAIPIDVLTIREEGPFATLAIIVGALVLILGLLFGRLAWTGRVSASIEEYGLDDDAEIAAHRDDARARGLLDD